MFHKISLCNKYKQFALLSYFFNHHFLQRCQYLHESYLWFVNCGLIFPSHPENNHLTDNGKVVLFQ